MKNILADKQNPNIKLIITDTALSVSFIVNIASGSISNYSDKIFLLKILSSFLLFILIIADIKLTKVNIKHLLKENNPLKLVIILALFTLYLFLTLTYSDDASYGLQKILNFITSTIPSIFAFYYFLLTYSKEKLKIFIAVVVIITITSVIYILISYPFEPGTIYKYRAGRWSHVIYGRMIGAFAVVFLLYLLRMIDVESKSEDRSKKKAGLRKIVFFIFIISLAVYGLYLSSLRSAMLSFIVVTIFILLFLIVNGLKFRVRKPDFVAHSNTGRMKPVLAGKQIASILLILILTFLMIISIPKPQIVESRFKNLTKIENLNFGGDEPINTRIEALRISKDLFLEQPVFGVGFGGFRAYNKFTRVVKYPHNIFAEMAVEGGVIGLLVLSALLFILLRSIFRFSSHFSHLTFPVSHLTSYFLLFASYAFFLSLFSKDLPSQTMLWIFLAFTGLKNRTAIS